jgi:GTP-binding protein EngB required for normal cell division
MPQTQEPKTVGSTDSSIGPALERLEEAWGRFGITAIEPYLEACGDLLRESRFIDVGIFGRFKAGKSSLLNHLAGRAVLPVGVTPVTAVITRLRYGVEERATVEYLDGRSETVALDLAPHFISESGNPANTRGVAGMTLELPELARYRGLQFVDTPGLDSVFQHNTETVLGWLPRAGLAVVTVSVDPPLSRHDVALIRTLSTFTPRIVILLTKVDLLSQAERQEVAAFVREELGKEFTEKFRILPFSIRPGEGALQEALDRDLLDPMRRNVDAERKAILHFKFKALLDHTRDYLSIALAAANRADTDRAALKRQILDEKTSFETVRMELQALAEQGASQTRPWIMSRMEEMRAGVEGRVTAHAKQRLAGTKANMWTLSRAFESWLREALEQELRNISRREGSDFCETLERSRGTLSRAVQGFRDRLAGNVQRALDIQLAASPVEFEVKKPAAPMVSVSNVYMFSVDLLWFVVPMFIFRPWIERHLLGRICWEVEKNLSRLASQWTEGINAAIFSMMRQAERSVKEQLLTVEHLLTRTRSEAGAIRSALDDVELLLRGVETPPARTL